MNNLTRNTPMNKEEAVTNLQKYLRRLSFEDEAYDTARPPIDGIFDSATEEAVANFQRKNGLRITGVADKETWDKIFAEYLRATEAQRLSEGLFIFPDAPSDYTISRGDALTLVRILQLLLLELRVTYDVFEDVVESGTYDAKTQKAIEDFQRINGLSATGDVDAATWNRLVREYANLGKRDE